MSGLSTMPMRRCNLGYYVILTFCFGIRSERGIPPLVELLQFPNSEVQRVAAAALGTLSFNNEANKNQVGKFLLSTT